jgi:Ni/Co efflux regulator RcnB
MKTLISAALAPAALAISLLGTAGAASAAPYFYHGPMHGPVIHRDVVRYVPARHVWVRGERFVPRYERFVVVDDWRGFRLPRPAFGAHWVRVGGNFLLIGNRNGVVLDVVGRY